MITTTEEAIAYLRPIADSATLNNYQQALRIAIKAMEDSARASARDLITNADRIRAMTDDQLADVVMCPYDAACLDGEIEERCTACCLKWLQAKAEG